MKLTLVFSKSYAREDARIEDALKYLECVTRIINENVSSETLDMAASILGAYGTVVTKTSISADNGDLLIEIIPNYLKPFE